MIDQGWEEYLRAYIGQLSRSSFRISVEHIGQIRRANTASLHHFILACGQGHRFANFLRLWHIGPGSLVLSATQATVENDIVRNILKMSFCRTFKTLPDILLTEIFGPSPGREGYANVGLNVLPPILQGLWVPPDQRDKYAKMQRVSSDPENTAWLDVRAKRLSEQSRKETRQRKAGVLTAGNYRLVITNLAKENGVSPESIKSLSIPATVDAPVDLKSEFEHLEKVGDDLED